ncbi:MAG: DNA-processing protein DprA [Sphaerochaeta sp.]|nr:DNA-processing protein DprA [Sphaerochaeta sp.]
MKLSLLLAISLLPLTGPAMLALARQDPSKEVLMRTFPQHWHPGRVARMLSFLSQADSSGHATDNGVVFLGMEGYPPLLAAEENPPFRLLYRGRLPAQGEPMISVCGTRKADLQGESCSYALALEAAANKVSVVTSHSSGIDRSALYGASDGRGSVFVTCDCGLDTPRIRGNRLLGGMNLISAFEPDDAPLRYRCLSRNVLTAALSPLLVVVQAPQRSGSLHCASLGLDMGREVVVHQSGLRPLPWCEGTRALAQDGCPVVDGYPEIAAFLGYGQTKKVTPATGNGPLYRYGNSCYSICHEPG